MYLAMCICNLKYLMNTSVFWLVYILLYVSTSQKSQTYRSDYSNTTNTTSNHSSPPISDQGSKSCTSTPETFQTGASPAMALGFSQWMFVPPGATARGHTTNQNGTSSISKTINGSPTYSPTYSPKFTYSIPQHPIPNDPNHEAPELVVVSPSRMNIQHKSRRTWRQPRAFSAQSLTPQLDVFYRHFCSCSID